MHEQEDHQYAASIPNNRGCGGIILAVFVAVMLLAGCVVFYEKCRTAAITPPSPSQGAYIDSTAAGGDKATDTFSTGINPEIERAYDSEVKANGDTLLSDSFHPYPGRILFHAMDSADRAARDSCISVFSFPKNRDTVYMSRGNMRPIAKRLKSTGRVVWMDTAAYQAAKQWMKKYHQKTEGREL